MDRYEVVTYRFVGDSPIKTYREGEISRITIEDLFNDGQIVVQFPIKVSKRERGSMDVFGANINNAELAINMANRLCEQMNRESGYYIRKTT